MLVVQELRQFGLMIVHYFDLISMSILPLKTDAPLYIDANAVLFTSTAREFLEVIGWWYL